ncbi:MAG: globin domain-containing protein [Ignavibacteria bacterium]
MHNLTNKEIKLIQESFQQLSEKSNKLGKDFYQLLFERNPELKELFKIDMNEQALALMRMVKTVVEGLNNPQIIIPAVQQLGKRHSDYGVEYKHYKDFGICLIECIEKELQPNFSKETKRAWEKLYNLLADVMKTE